MRIVARNKPGNSATGSLETLKARRKKKRRLGGAAPETEVKRIHPSSRRIPTTLRRDRAIFWVVASVGGWS